MTETRTSPKLPLLTQAIRDSDTDKPPTGGKSGAATDSSGTTPFGSRTPVDRSEMLQKLKTEIFKNLHKQPSEIFSNSKRAGSPIKQEVLRKRSKSDQDGVTTKPVKNATKEVVPATLPVKAEPVPVSVKVEPATPPMKVIEKGEPIDPDSDTDTLSEGEIIPRPVRRPAPRLKPESSQAKFARIINRRPLPPSELHSHYSHTPTL